MTSNKWDLWYQLLSTFDLVYKHNLNSFKVFSLNPHEVVGRGFLRCLGIEDLKANHFAKTTLLNLH